MYEIRMKRMLFTWSRSRCNTPGLPTGGSNWRLRVGRWMHPRPGWMILTDFSEPKQAQRSGLVALAYWFITTKDWPQTNPYQYAVCSYARHVLTYLAIKSMVLWQVHAHVWGPSCDTASAFTWGLLHIFLNLFEQLYIDDCVKNRHPMWSCI